MHRRALGAGSGGLQSSRLQGRHYQYPAGDSHNGRRQEGGSGSHRPFSAQAGRTGEEQPGHPGSGTEAQGGGNTLSATAKYIDYNGDGQFIPATGDRYIPYGASGWTQLVGDWNGDGKSEIGIFKDGLWYIDYGGSGVIDANTKYYSFGGAGWTPLIGDWNADKKDKIGVYNAGNWYLDYDGTGVWSAGDKNYGFGTTGWIPVIGKWT